MISPERLRQHVMVLAQEIGERNIYRPQALIAAQDYIAGQWQAQGYTVTFHRYETQGVVSANLEITRRGRINPDEYLLIGAHYDSVQGSPGANDNGSGVAAMLEISRLFAQAEPVRSVRFVAFVNEEPPFFFWNSMGSLVYAKAAYARHDNIRFMVSLETMGYFRDEPGGQNYPVFFRHFYPDKGDFIAFVSNFRSRRLMHRAATAFRSHSHFPLEHTATFSWIPGIGWSDHLSFWRQGYRAMMVTDTAFYRYPYYHTALDTPEKIDYPRLAQVSEGLYDTFIELACQKKL